MLYTAYICIKCIHMNLVGMNCAQRRIDNTYQARYTHSHENVNTEPPAATYRAEQYNQRCDNDWPENNRQICSSHSTQHNGRHHKYGQKSQHNSCLHFRTNLMPCCTPSACSSLFPVFLSLLVTWPAWCVQILSLPIVSLPLHRFGSAEPVGMCKQSNYKFNKP